MALSYCSNWSSSATSLDLTTTDLFAPDQYSINTNNHFLDQDQDQDLLLYYDNTYLLPYFSSPPDSLVSLNPDIFPSAAAAEDYDSSCHYLKRRKSFEDCFANVNAVNANVPCFFDGFNVPNSYSALAPEFLPPPPPLPEFQVPPPEEGGKKGGGSLSAQSMAARQRRKKITEKTQELGKLVPGGTKMNTAEMFHAASKYVKWLQSQVAILQLMASFQEEEEEEETEKPLELQVLLGSPMIQEKLYSEEKCLVPRKFVENLANDAHIQSKPLILKDIDRLLLQPKK